MINDNPLWFCIFILFVAIALNLAWTTSLARLVEHYKWELDHKVDSEDRWDTTGGSAVGDDDEYGWGCSEDSQPGSMTPGDEWKTGLSGDWNQC